MKKLIFLLAFVPSISMAQYSADPSVINNLQNMINTQVTNPELAEKCENFKRVALQKNPQQTPQYSPECTAYFNQKNAQMRH